MHDPARSQRSSAVAAPQPGARPRRKLTRGFWLRHLHTWHWISSAVALVGLLLFVLTGFTLNHAADIGANPSVVEGAAELDAEALALVASLPETGTRPLPSALRKALSGRTDLAVTDAPAELGADEIYLAMPRPGGDTWIAIDRTSGVVEWEATDRGWIAYFNDLHKGRDTGAVWRLFIDVFVFASLVFIGTGFVLLWLHGKNRPSTWPLTGLGLLVPLLLALFFVH
ncbi:PepSY-associated TM helix domain-containing protein [Novosphingobium mangrovi (ex Huang et al. 2023)]|uniref:PepSY-associated TM helix domain-containing protein n=1 Tax=Novosphingobium mangrovi (ex Huang et al. 2023) TaxID=2976432 RepID=A0ABT2I0V8_9SPHN|nr:PepSY-associated TM helix domain-containing protein [Novosphingobium mangrovi (ex Huang et al. 2023)]MCT2398438.1 PepSY-associated TM helix domain-containing protein [Novosphingobium mangrovi (ex Huang et al. 2023)]